MTIINSTPAAAIAVRVFNNRSAYSSRLKFKITDWSVMAILQIFRIELSSKFSENEPEKQPDSELLFRRVFALNHRPSPTWGEELNQNSVRYAPIADNRRFNALIDGI